MIPAQLDQIFGNDPWWLVLLKVVVLFVFLLAYTIFNVWYERRVVGKMQHRLGPTMNGPFGLGQALGDGAKLILKEDFRPAKADVVVFTLAPIVMGVCAFTAWSVMPFGGEVEIFGVTTRLQLTDFNVSVLFLLAVASIGIYGVVLAGWASNSPYSLLGGLRSSAQMISYEVSMGLALVGVFMMSGSMSTSQIVDAQNQASTLALGGFELPLPTWYAVVLFPSFLLYVISMVGETNRAPFDLPECESELVSGYLTEYTGFRYAMFFLAEYINMATVSAIATTLFLGGYRAPVPFNMIPALDSAWMGPVWFILKVQLFMFVFVWLRGTLPRLRYDQFMSLGWKWLIPAGLVWVILLAVFRYGQRVGWFEGPVFMIAVAVIFVLLLGLALFGGKEPEPDGPADTSGEFDAFAGGYPVPPMGDQVLPELAGVVRGSPDDENDRTEEKVGASSATDTDAPEETDR
ncbi:NADH-quinone oxidoreductase subunit NuoH [Parenemella sanctibonifatiensis]|uniref:NADH-quinone oxidoreductase subunit H n=1 Tax=Parenemella sanctibonifatiensis TaxID=2016505 RepID=A0A255EBN7_9ACTN|nr:NADH-quinone oxidoreductase subunit NuoH [Parenemella sanctibonifatiensis]OYN87494.1 NADH-quinone oxidoreductase subunit H [Parenemella sanctibonifatiensis]OYN88967.1 NADH-quinone oxidoreductase subunit H [Parenemella sanctibonifatiensis]